VSEHKKRIELFFLPSYSPELNPDVSRSETTTLNRRAKQYLNQGLKKVIFRHGIAKDKPELDAKLEISLYMLEIRPKTIKSFFQHPKVRYAA
jgi:hypothetical protein